MSEKIGISAAIRRTAEMMPSVVSPTRRISAAMNANAVSESVAPSTCALISFSLLLVLVLDRPLAGDLTVSPQPFKESSLSRFWPPGEAGLAAGEPAPWRVGVLVVDGGDPGGGP
ncbi:hypothetical protein [Streptomyces sp. NPDC058157]|uniref:hypothetical protein n=1 Tax=Streptomyces sp. NPDC058157 TaxID=3346360 RepID=UPI0036E7A9B7